MRVVEAIDGRAVAARHQMAIHINRHLNRAVPHLFLHVREALALLNQERREGVSQIVEPDLSNLSLFEDAREDVAHVRVIEEGAQARRKHHVRELGPVLQRICLLAQPERDQGVSQLHRHIDAAPLMVLRRRDHTAYKIPIDRQKAPAEVEIGPLQGDQLTLAESRSERTEQQRVPAREVFARGRQQPRDFVAGERLNVRLRFVAIAEVPAHT